MAELVNVILSILILIFTGFISKKIGILQKEHTSVLNNLIIYFAMPALIFRAVVNAKISISLLVVPLIALGVMTICLGVAYILGRFIKLERPTYGAIILMAAIGNTGFLGYPLALELFGLSNFIRAIFYDLFGTVIFMFTVGLFVSGKFGEGEAKINIAKEVLTFPPLLGLFAALILGNFTLPSVLTKTVDFLAGAAIPLIMFSIGLSLEFAGLGKYKLEIGLVSLVKLVVSPLIALIGALLIGMTEVDLGITVLEASMPSFLFSLILGIRYGLDTDFIPPAIVATTMLSMITIPVWQYILRVLL